MNNLQNVPEYVKVTFDKPPTGNSQGAGAEGTTKAEGSMISIEKMKQELTEYTLHNMTLDEIIEAAERGIRQTLDKMPLSVVEWKHQTLFGESYD